jgi:tRNA threonylcarbamoyladenosine biosynthesis protein TsaB
MNILALDTATERCSVALLLGERLIERAVETQRGHADLVLPMVESVLAEGDLELRAVDAVAYGRGPGAFTGVRIAVGVAQGLAFGLDVPTIGVSTLAVVALQFAQPGREILVCMDARMGEVYWARFRCGDDGFVEARGEEFVSAPELVQPASADVFAGTGFKAYPQLAPPGALAVHAEALPHAREVARLATRELKAGRAVRAADAAPVYLRDQVAVPTKK